MRKWNKVFLLGIPHFNWKLVKIMIKEGWLKSFKEMIKNGCYGEIIPQQETGSTPVEFTSMITGVKKEKHGIGYGKYSDKEYVEGGRIYTRLDIKVKTIWEIALKYKKRVGIYHWLLTWPPRKINGFMVTGRLSQDKNRFYPKEIEKIIYFYPEPDFFNTQVAIQLLEKYNVDLFLGMEERVHGPLHEFWRYVELSRNEDKRKKLFDCFKEVDLFIGEVKRRFPEATVMVVSDSGMKVREYPIYTLGNEVIEFFNRLNVGFQLYACDIYPSFLPKAKPCIYLPGKSKSEKKRIVHILSLVKYKKNGRKFFKNIKWKGDYLSFSFNFHPSFVNYRSNWFYLILPSGEEFRMWVIKQTGSSYPKGGVFVISGPSVKRNYFIGGVNTIDIAPTVLYFLNIPIPKYMEGKVLNEVIK